MGKTKHNGIHGTEAPKKLFYNSGGLKFKKPKTPIKNLRKCAYNPNTNKNEELFLLKNDSIAYTSDLVQDTIEIDENTFRSYKGVKGNEDIFVVRTFHTPTQKSIHWNRTNTVEFSADKGKYLYRYNTSENNLATVLDAWKLNNTYLSASMGLTHEFREMFVLDVDCDLYKLHPNATSRESKIKLVVNAAHDKIKELASNGVPQPSSISINISNSHYQMQWYMTNQIRKSSFNMVNDICNETAHISIFGEGFIPLLKALNIVFGGDSKFTGWRCRNIYCTHLDDYINYAIFDGKFIKVSQATEFKKYTPVEMYTALIKVALNENLVKLAKRNCNGDSSIIADWKQATETCKNLVIKYGGLPKEESARNTENCKQAQQQKYTKSITQTSLSAKNFKKIKQIYKKDKVGAICAAYAGENSRHTFWLRSPLLIKYLDKDMEKETALNLLRTAYNEMLKTGNNAFGNLATKGVYTERELQRDFGDGWKYATSKEIYSQWTDEQRERSAEVNKIKYKFRKVMMINFIVTQKIDITHGAPTALVEKLSTHLSIKPRTIRKMLNECLIKPSRKRHYGTLNREKLSKGQIAEYNKLYFEVIAHLRKSDNGKDFNRSTFAPITIGINDDFCRCRNYHICNIDNTVGREGEKMLPNVSLYEDFDKWLLVTRGVYMEPDPPSDD